MKARSARNTVLGRQGFKLPDEKRAGARARADALGRLAFLLSAAHNPVDAAQYVVDTALEFFKWECSFLVLYNSETDRVDDLVNMDTVDGRRQRVPAVLQDKPPSPMMRKVLEEGPQLILRHEAHDPGPATAPFGDKGRLSLSLMYVPVRLENKPIGVLSVQSYKAGAYNTKDLEILQGLADHAAGALARLQVETELRSSEERLRLAVQSAGLGTWEYQHDTGQLNCSETSARILGLEKAGKSSFDSFLNQLQRDNGRDPAELLQALISNRFQDRLHLECRLRRPDGTERWVVLGASRFPRVTNRLPTAVGLIGTLLDITERKQTEFSLRSAQEKLQAHAQELKETVELRTARLEETVTELEHVSYALKHDMRAPLRAMQVFAELAEQELAQGGCPTGMEYLRLIRLASKRLDRLLQDSLTYNKAVVDRPEMHPIKLDTFLAGLIETYPQLQTGKAEIKLEGNMPVVLGNEAALTQCFANLLDNAVKFAQPGKKASVRVWAEDKGDRARVWVEDHGIGIPKRAQGRIFDMFQRVTKDHEGTGIGLAIVRKVVQRMDGSVGVESEEGHGSRFWVELKLAA